MAKGDITKNISYDKIEVINDWNIQLRQATKLMEEQDDGSKVERDTNTIFESNGGIAGSCTSVFLFMILLIAFFTKGPAKADEMSSTGATLSDGGSETSINDLLGTTDTTEEQTDED